MKPYPVGEDYLRPVLRVAMPWAPHPDVRDPRWSSQCEKLFPCLRKSKHYKAERCPVLFHTYSRYKWRLRVE